MSNIDAEISAGLALAKGLPSVVDAALIGSAMYLPQANDVDFAVLIEPNLNAVDYSTEMVSQGWGNCGEYDGVGGVWAAVRRDNLNFMITPDRQFFDGFKLAMEVCKVLRLTNKEDRIAVCKVVRDRIPADQVRPPVLEAFL